MRIGVISDIHGNIVALDTVLRDMPAVDSLVCAGDVVGYNPWPGECVERIRDRDVPTVMGNHDRAVVSNSAFGFNSMAKAGVDHARARLTDDQLEWLSDLPATRRIADGRIRVVHGHPKDPDHYTYPAEFSAELLVSDPDDPVRALIMGHTHIQYHETYDRGVVLNPGSVGQPRDGDPRAAYAILDLGDTTVEEHRVEYDIDAVAEAVTESGLPEAIGERLYKGR